MSLILTRLAVPAHLHQATTWAIDPIRRSSIVIALALIPFAGIAFLWFVGAVRARKVRFPIGHRPVLEAAQCRLLHRYGGSDVDLLDRVLLGEVTLRGTMALYAP